MIRWTGFGTTKGRMVYARALTENTLHGVNYDVGFLVGWDQWSDGRHSYWYPPLGQS